MDKLDQPFILEEANWKSVLEHDYKVAIIPFGATEAHNYHLPYATDNYQVDFVAHKAAAKAWELGAKLVVLPCIPYGINTGQMDIKFCMNILPSTQLCILKDLYQVLENHGIEKVLLLNGHGGNNFKNIIREMSYAYPDIFTCWVNWYQIVDWNQYFDEPGDHAGEMETSAMMLIRPDLVRPLSEAGDGFAKSFKASGFKEGWASAQRAWSLVTADTGVGNPAKSNPEKAAKYLNDCVDKLAVFIKELHETPNDSLYD